MKDDTTTPAPSRRRGVGEATRQPVAAAAAAVAVLALLFIARPAAFEGTLGVVAVTVLLVISSAIGILVRRHLAAATFDGRSRVAAAPLFVCAGALFVLLAVAAPASAIIASGTWAPLRVVDQRTLVMVGVSSVTLAIALVAAVQGLVRWIRSLRAVSGRLTCQAGSDVVVQGWAWTVLLGTVFILY